MLIKLYCKNAGPWETLNPPLHPSGPRFYHQVVLSIAIGTLITDNRLR